MLTKTQIQSQNAPKAIGPYSQALRVGDFIYCSPQLGLDPFTMEFVDEDVLLQARQAFKNLEALLVEAGTDLEHVVKVEIFLTDMNFFPAVSELYGEIFTSTVPPVRQTVEASALPKWAKIMVSCTAIAKES